MAQLGILTLHGMGSTERNYADAFFDEIHDRLGPDLIGHVHMQSVYYQDILQHNQKAYFDSVKRRLRWDELRKFMLYGFCDAASLESQKTGQNSPYFQAQSRVLESLKALFSRLDEPDRKLIIVAQSLGGQVMSNYLWDASRVTARDGVWSVPQSFASQEEEDFCRGAKTARLFTTGCNIPIFVAGMDRDDIKAIPKLSSAFEWHNYFDKDDVLGWPLRNLSDSYAQTVTKDHAINAGVLTGFTPLSHGNYWKDRDFLKPLMRAIKRCL